MILFIYMTFNQGRTLKSFRCGMFSEDRKTMSRQSDAPIHFIHTLKDITFGNREGITVFGSLVERTRNSL